MKILSGIPVINCRSIEQTLVFYTRLLQFVMVNQRKDGEDLKWVHLVHADTSLMLQRIETDTASSQAVTRTNMHEPSVSLYFFVDDITSLHRLLSANQVKVSSIVDTDYRLREMSARDPEGNSLRFGEAIKS
jgi:hypothetical protein